MAGAEAGPRGEETIDPREDPGAGCWGPLARAHDIDDLNWCLHEVLLFRLHLTRLEFWSDKLVDLQYFELGVLSFLEAHPESTVGQLREFLQVPQSTLTSMLGRLERRDLVRRDINPKDKRSYTLALTASGVEAQREHRRVSRLISRKMLDALPDEADRQRFVDLFRRIARGL